ncbi:MAG: amino acid adenylation domain-containing protein [Thermoanaerobaculia bacterium]|nr:amino acid adenylation domain-containing protein [Thermoanaerobaculia bacterium]
MTRIDSLFARLKRLDVRLWLEDGQLRYRAPRGALNSELLAELKQRKPEIIAFLTRVERAEQDPQLLPRRRDRPAPLSFPQQRFWFLDQLDGPDPTYNVPATHLLEGCLSTPALAQAFDAVVRRHESLRTTIEPGTGVASQRIAPHSNVVMPLVDLAGLPSDLRSATADRLARQHAQCTFDLVAGPLLRATVLRESDARHRLLTNFHHIVADGWSNGLVVREVAALYEAWRSGNPSPLAPVSLQYADYACWQREVATEQRIDEQLEFWRRTLVDAPDLLDLPADRPRPAVPSTAGDVVRFRLSEDLVGRFKTQLQDQGATLFMGLIAVYALLLQRYSGQTDIVVGVPSSNRSRLELESMIGCFVDSLPMRFDLARDPSFEQLVARVRRTALDAYANEDVPFEKVVEAVHPDRSLAHSPIFQVAFVLQNMPRATADLGELRLEYLPTDRRTAKYDVSLLMEESDGGIEAELEFRTDRFDRWRIEAMAKHYERLLEAAVCDAGCRLSQLAMLDVEERERLLRATRGLAPRRTQDDGLEGLFDRVATDRPDAIAVVHGRSHVSYRSLRTRSATICRRLRARGVQRGAIVALALPSSVDLIAAMLGVLRAGAAYLPLDPTHPIERLDEMLADSRAMALVTRRELADTVGSLVEEPLFVDGSDLQVENPAGRVSATPTPVPAGAPAYMIYTSGSTGRPKGVAITRDSVVGLVNGLLTEVYGACDPSAARRVALVASPVFDASVQQIFASLLGGHALHLLDADQKRDGQRFARFLLDRRIQISDGTPTLLAMMLEAGQEELFDSSLEQLLIGGEPLPVEALRRVAAVRGPHLRLSNLYGPTECCVDATVADIDFDALPCDAVALIGRPLPGHEVYLLDPTGEPLPTGIPGEIFLGGRGLGLGYLGRPAHTAASFVPSPFHHGERLYRTGDRGRSAPGGDVEFLGRDDDQVKVRGYRIELGEVEAVIRGHRWIAAVAVVVHPSTENELVAYIVWSKKQGGATSDGSASRAELRRHCERRLPSYMIPSLFIELPDIPRTPSGKLDRGALPQPHRLQSEVGEPALPPRTELEHRLAAAWQSVLGLGAVDIRRSFFELGGDSIKALQIAGRMRGEGFSLEVRDLFLHPTIEELAPRLAPLAPLVADDLPSGRFPLIPIQRWFFDRFSGRLSHYNQALLLALDQRADDTLEAGLTEIVRRHPAFRLRFTQEGGRWWQRYADVEDGVAFQVVDLAHSAEPEEELYRHSTSLQASFDLEHGPLFAAALYRLPDGDRLLLAAHHLVIDAVSWRIVLEELDLLLRGGTVDQLTVEATSYSTWSSHLMELAATEPESQWADTTQDDGFLPVVEASPPPRFGDRESIRFELSRRSTEALLGPCHRAYGTEIDDLLLTALGRALVGWRGGSRVAVALESHGRHSSEGIDLSRTVGWFTCFYPVLLELEASAGLRGQIKLVKETLRAIPAGGLGYGLLRYPPGAETSSEPDLPEVTFNYLGQLDRDLATTTFSLASERVGPHVAADAHLLAELEVVAMILDRCLTVEIGYGSQRFRNGSVESLATALEAELEAVIAHTEELDHPVLTPSDIDYDGFDIQQLDAFLDSL